MSSAVSCLLYYVVAGGDDDDSGSISALRMLRVLRPLRSITHIQTLRVVVSALVTSAPALVYTMLLYFFVLCFFAEVSGWGAYCHDFARLPITPRCSVRVSCPRVDARLTLHDINFRRLLPSPAVFQCIQPV